MQCLPLKLGIPEDGPKAEASLDLMERNRPPFDSYSYYPEILYRYKRNESAYHHLLTIADPQFSGYAMAGTAYAAIGSIWLSYEPQPDTRAHLAPLARSA